MAHHRYLTLPEAAAEMGLSIAYLEMLEREGMIAVKRTLDDVVVISSADLERARVSALLTEELEVNLAGAEVLERYFGERFRFRTCSDTLPSGSRCSDPVPVYRSFNGFSEAAAENGLSRIYIGFHFRRAVTEGIEHGRSIGKYTFQNFLRPVNPRSRHRAPHPAYCAPASEGQGGNPQQGFRAAVRRLRQGSKSKHSQSIAGNSNQSAVAL